MFQSSSDLSKEILRNVFREFTIVTNKAGAIQQGIFGLDLSGRIKFFRNKSNGTNKLTPSQLNETYKELVLLHDASNWETETVKKFMQTYNSVYPRFIDSEGYIDLTKYYSTSYLYAKGSFKDKMISIFQLIDENGDGLLSKSEVEKFFRIILDDTFNLFKTIVQNPNVFPIFSWSPEQINQIKNSMPEFEKIFDISKLDRLVHGAFTADTNHDGMISFEEWSNWCETDHYKEEWGTISLLFEAY